MMSPWSKKIEDLESDLRLKEEEIKRMQERHVKEIETLKQQHADECKAIRTEVEGADEALDATNKELSATRIELNKMRSQAQDLNNYRAYVKRLVQPVSAEEITKVYPGYTLTVTPAFFKLEDKHGISWLIERAGYLRRYTGYVANLFNTPNYAPLRDDHYFQQALPKDIKSNLEIVFAERRGNKLFRLCPPLSATAIVVSFLAEATAVLQGWCDGNKQAIIADDSCQKHLDLRQISVVLPFPVQLPTMQITLLDGEDCTETDLAHLSKTYDNQLREACQHIYMREFFLDATYFSTKRNEDTNDGQVKKSD